MKCDNCLNSRGIMSENGWHHICCLSVKRATLCLAGKMDFYEVFPSKPEYLKEREKHDGK